jgi:hypothetical protein
LQQYDLVAGPLIDRLLQRQLPDGSWRQMTQLTALAVLALQSVDEGRNVYQF